MIPTRTRLNLTISWLAVASAQQIWEFYSANEVFPMFLAFVIVVSSSIREDVSLRIENPSFSARDDGLRWDCGCEADFWGAGTSALDELNGYAVTERRRDSYPKYLATYR